MPIHARGLIDLGRHTNGTKPKEIFGMRVGNGHHAPVGNNELVHRRLKSLKLMIVNYIEKIKEYYEYKAILSGNNTLTSNPRSCATHLHLSPRHSCPPFQVEKFLKH